ncbi:hypothetical protein KAX17_10940 [Candidatus Bipolaricaulota bacterium]|nr:hypothetical protein [Candidatus Bipolaricaulota bacterium]
MIRKSYETFSVWYSLIGTGSVVFDHAEAERSPAMMSRIGLCVTAFNERLISPT